MFAPWSLHYIPGGYFKHQIPLSFLCCNGGFGSCCELFEVPPPPRGPFQRGLCELFAAVPPGSVFWPSSKSTPPYTHFAIVWCLVVASDGSSNPSCLGRVSVRTWHVHSVCMLAVLVQVVRGCPQGFRIATWHARQRASMVFTTLRGFKCSSRSIPVRPRIAGRSGRTCTIVSVFSHRRD